MAGLHKVGRDYRVKLPLVAEAEDKPAEEAAEREPGLVVPLAVVADATAVRSHSLHIKQPDQQLAG